MNEKILEFLNQAARFYYAGDPIIPDEVFDKLSEIYGYDAVGTKQHSHLYKHLFPMYSLQKYYEGEGKRPDISDAEKDISPKLDGAAISLLFINNELVRVLTRGDGIEGTDVTDKFLNTKLIPKILLNKGAELPPVLQITGELVAPKHVENSRNYAAGSLNLKSIDEFKTRSLEFFAYGLQPLNENSTFIDDMRLLKSIGFSTVKDENIHNIYPCDGVVHRLNSNKEFISAGYTSKHPRGAYAVKERGSSVETKLLDVVWQTGKTGKVTPVAILEPVQIGDAIIQRATLNNIAFIRALELEIGDTVGVQRAGEIIPCVTHRVV